MMEENAARDEGKERIREMSKGLEGEREKEKTKEKHNQKEIEGESEIYR